MKRRSFLASLLLAPTALAHSPWGQYTVYRQKHLLILSSKTDPDSYPYSELLVDAINREEPSAKARAARAKNLERCHSLFLTNQMQFMLLPRQTTLEMREGTGQFSGRGSLPIKTIYEFGGLTFSVRSDMNPNIIRIVTYSILEQLDALPNASSPSQMLKTKSAHIESLTAITTFLAENSKS